MSVPLLSLAANSVPSKILRCMPTCLDLLSSVVNRFTRLRSRILVRQLICFDLLGTLESHEFPKPASLGHPNQVIILSNVTQPCSIERIRWQKTDQKPGTCYRWSVVSEKLVMKVAS